nr:hypothetical protein [Tanacetum cinerariifolium]
MESNGSEGSGRDDSVGINEVRERSDVLNNGMLNDNADTNASIDGEVSAKKVVIDPVNGVYESIGKIKDEGVAQKTYVNIMKNDDLPKNLIYILTLVTDSGNEMVIFNEALVNKGNEIKRALDGKKKPLLVTKRSADMGMEKLEQKSLHVWVKIVNIPLEAWSVDGDGISAIANSLRKPMMMDTNTASMCHRVKVVYDWKPPTCVHCKVFGHDAKHYSKGGANGGGNENNTVETSVEGKVDQNSGTKVLEIVRLINGSTMAMEGEKNRLKESNAGVEEVEVEDVFISSTKTKKIIEENMVNDMEGNVLNENVYGV